MKSLISSPSTSLPQKWEPQGRSHLPLVGGRCASLSHGFCLAMTFTVTIATISSVSSGMKLGAITGGPRNNRVSGLWWVRAAVLLPGCWGNPPHPARSRPVARVEVRRVRCWAGGLCLISRNARAESVSFRSWVMNRGDDEDEVR